MGPAVVIILCGKRKSGKDYVAEKLVAQLSDVCSVLRLSKPLKEQYAKDHALDLHRLLDASEYKEAYRKDMIRWGEEMRERDPAYFCRLASQDAENGRPVWLVTDARRPTDMDYFKSLYPCITVRVTASEGARTERGWAFTAGVDDAASECALDGYPCDVTILNEGNEATLTNALQNIIAQVRRFVDWK